MLAHSDLLAKELLTMLFLGDPWLWRRRQVLQLTPLNPQSYRARTSYQFHFTRELIREASRNAFQNTLLPPDPPEDEIEIILPIDYLPKCVLLDFSLEDMSGKPLPLLTSADTTPLSFEVVRTAMPFLDLRCGDGANTAQVFFQHHRDIILSVIATGQGEISARLTHLRAFHQWKPLQLDFQMGVTTFYGEALEQFSGQRQLHQDILNSCYPKLSETYQRISQMTPELKTYLGGSDGYYDPLLNPAVLIVDYLKSLPAVAPGQLPAIVDDFLDRCNSFIAGILVLLDDERRFWPIVSLLARMDRAYVAYVRLKIPIGRDFILKMDQIIPGETQSHWKSPTRALRYRNYQWYPLKIADSRSSHIEISCEHPVELEQVPSKTLVLVGDQYLPAGAIFGRSGYATKYHQHFYTQKSLEQLQLVLQARGTDVRPMAILDIKLGIKYAVEATTRWGYRLVTIVVFVALAFLVSVYDPAKMRSGQLSVLPIIAVLFALFGALASLRPQENVVAVRTRKYKIMALGMGFLMALYFLVGLLYQEAIESVRTVIRELGLGRWLI